MKCPVCSASSLHRTTLESQLSASSCSECNGKWITATDYWAWLNHHGEALPEQGADECPIEVEDMQKAKLCPSCRRIMIRQNVGHNLGFSMDQCGSCNGIWFDANKWEALKQRNLHGEIHLISSAPWQSENRKDKARQSFKTLYADMFDDDYEKVKQIKAWIDHHPNQEKILNYLSNPNPYDIGSTNVGYC